ncbi:MAG: rhodanese-like domain-containing protein [Desulfobacterales bacterium]
MDLRKLMVDAQRQRRNPSMLRVLFVAFSIFIFCGHAIPSAVDYISAEKLHQMILSEEPFLLLDLSPAAQFSQRHIPGAKNIDVYPLETTVQQQRLKVALPGIRQKWQLVVLVCPKGGMTALRAAQLMRSNGFGPTEIMILKNGMLGWPYTTAGRSAHQPSTIDGPDS